MSAVSGMKCGLNDKLKEMFMNKKVLCLHYSGRCDYQQNSQNTLIIICIECTLGHHKLHFNLCL